MNESAPDAGGSVSLSAELRVDAVCQRFEAACKAGVLPRPENFLAGWEEPERSVLLRELLLIARAYHRHAGETPSLGNHLNQSTTVPRSVDPIVQSFPRPFGRYSLQRLLGQGGMGCVYLAHDPQLDRFVALKMPNPVESVSTWRERFLTEARAAATLTHPNVCPVHEVGEEGGQPYLTMAFIEGETLAKKLDRDGTFAPEEAVALVETVARAMHEAHRRGIVHRDLKPANLMLDSAVRPIIMDFGLAIRSTNSDDLRITLTGVALGTPAYMPPEQAGGDSDAVGPASDVYSLGVILYELVTGQVPFRNKKFGKLLAQIMRDEPPPPSSMNPKVDPALEAIILTALAKSPADRFETAGDLAEALARHLNGDRAELISEYSRPSLVPATRAVVPASSVASAVAGRGSRRRSWWLAGAAAVLLAALGVAIYVETDYGQIVVELKGPHAKVDVRVNGQEVSLAVEGGKPIRVRAGKDQKLVVTGDGFETVSESFDLKRGDVHVARIVLVPRGRAPVGVGEKDKTGSPDPKKNDPVIEPKPNDPPRAVPYPKGPTLIEEAGWQILTDATKDEMQKWLDERKKDKHSVTWLDTFPLDGKLLYTAVAALDDRQPKWVALLDLPALEVGKGGEHWLKWIDPTQNRPVSVSGWLSGTEFRTAILFHPGSGLWVVTPAATSSFLADAIDKMSAQGLQPRCVRTLIAPTEPFTAAIMDSFHPKDGKAIYKLGVTEAKLTEFFEENRGKGLRPTSVAGYLDGNRARFSAAMVPDPSKAPWEVHTGITADTLKTKATELAAKGFIPASVTAYPFDGAVRYCVVWVKEPPKPVPFPKGPTLIEEAGWQILTDATKEEMQKWLDERKKDKHSVMWLDATTVDSKPVFSAIAVTDHREPGWTVLWDIPAEKASDMPLLKKSLDVGANWLVSMSGYAVGNQPHVVQLWWPGKKKWGAGADAMTREFQKLCDELTPNGMMLRFARPYPVGTRITMWAGYFEVSATQTTVFDLQLPDERLKLFLDQTRQNAQRPLSIAAYLYEGQPRFAVVAGPNAEKWEWQTDTNLTATGLKATTAAQLAKGFAPACVTAYPWDGAVRYCVIWVKEPRKPVPYPKGPTLIESPGWQILTDATKEEMQKWLDERKRDKHSVAWLDVTMADGKPLFSAIAALDDRQTDWIAMLAVPANNFGNGKLRQQVNKEDYDLRSLSGYPVDGKVTSAILFVRENKGWGTIPDLPVTMLADFERFEAKSARVIRSIRPFAFGEGTLVSVCTELIAEKPTYSLGLSPERLERELQSLQTAGKRPTLVTGYTSEGVAVFSVSAVLNKDKWQWDVSTGLTAGKLTSKAAEFAKKGFRPSSLTAYAWDGAVRYCVVWVKEPPKK